MKLFRIPYQFSTLTTGEFLKKSSHTDDYESIGYNTNFLYHDDFFSFLTMVSLFLARFTLNDNIKTVTYK